MKKFEEKKQRNYFFGIVYNFKEFQVKTVSVRLFY